MHTAESSLLAPFPLISFLFSSSFLEQVSHKDKFKQVPEAKVRKKPYKLKYLSSKPTEKFHLLDWINMEFIWIGICCISCVQFMVPFFQGICE